MKIKNAVLMAGLGLAFFAGNASAWSLGQVWVTDQKDGAMYIYEQSQLNTDPENATPIKIDLVATSADAGQPVFDGRNHLIAFNNVSGLDPLSRATLSFLHGEIQIRSTADPATPIFTDQAPTSANSLHMCGGNTANTEIMCSSIGGAELITYSADYATDTYARSGAYPIADLVMSDSVTGDRKIALEAVLDTMDLSGAKPICNNYSTDNALVIVTTTGTAKGVLVLDASDMSIVNALNNTGVGCGLVNSPNGRSMWTNAGSNSDTDDEFAYRWDYNSQQVGPSAQVDLPEDVNGDVHGAQFAGIGGFFLWELMRLDNKIHVISPHRAKVVHTIDLARVTGINNLGGDVLDRSAFGTRMYMSTRGYAPITAIGSFVDASRNPGVNVVGTFWGYGARGIGHASIRSGVLGDICFELPDGDARVDPQCPAGSIRLDNADPHGLKSLSYITGGF